MDEVWKAFSTRYPLLSDDLTDALRASTKSFLAKVERWEQLDDRGIVAAMLEIRHEMLDFMSARGYDANIEGSKQHPRFAELSERWWEAKDEAELVLARATVQTRRAIDTDAGLRFQAATAAKGGEAKKARDPKQAAKAKARELWNDWKDGKRKFEGVEKWAMKVVELYPILESVKNVASWNAKWEKERFPNRRRPGRKA